MLGFTAFSPAYGLQLQYDERGLPRVINLKPDIGAYERQAVDDQLLNAGFDSS